MEDNLDDQITDYLSGSLDREALVAFEQRIAAEPALAARMAFERELAETLDAATPENQLRANLRLLSEKYDSPERLGTATGASTGRNARLWWVLAAGLLLLGGWAYWNMGQQEKQDLSLPPTPLPPEPSANLPETIHPDTNKPYHKPPPIAAAFKPIAKLETYIGSQTRSGDVKFRVNEPAKGSTLRSRDGQTSFRFSGKLEGRAPQGSIFKLLIFSNNMQDFEAQRPLIKQALQFSQDGAFDFQKKLPLSPGLYYCLIEEDSSGEWLWVDKFWVK